MQWLDISALCVCGWICVSDSDDSDDDNNDGQSLQVCACLIQ
jgi:hypothetical protein